MNSSFNKRKPNGLSTGTSPFAAILALGILVALTFQSQAQGVRKGNIYTPPCGIEHPGDAGVRMHTNFHIVIGSGARFLRGGGLLPDVVGPDSTLPPPPPFTPAELEQIYDISSTGGSQIIAIVDAYHDPNSLSDFNAWSAFFGLPTESSNNALSSTNKVFQVIYPAGSPPSTDPAGPGGWDFEESLDIEWAHAMAPKAKIILVECANNTNANLFGGIAFITGYTDGNGNTVKEISNSWGGGEFSAETTYDTVYLNSPAVQAAGVAIFASAGDHGAPATYPSASPYVVSAGGTTVNVNSSNVLLSETAWSLSGGAGTGGGPSLYEARPSFQNIVSSIVGSVRGTPDIAFDADPVTGVWVYDSYYDNSIGEPGELFDVGGTSLSSPALAGIANSAATAENGFPSGSQALLTNIYTNYNNFYTSSPGDVFRDITSGSNPHPALTGWDFCTGVGSCIGVPGMWNINTPTANSQTVAVAHNSGGTAVTLTGSDTDSPALPLIYNGGTGPSHGTLSGTAPNLTYTPNAGFQGTDSFTFSVTNTYSLPSSPVITDKFYTSTNATVTLNVAAGTPTANAQSVNIAFNSEKGINLTGSDSEDSPALPLSYAIGTNPAHGTLTGFNSASGSVDYTPNTGYNGTDSFTFTVSNGTNTSSAATVTLTVATGVPTAITQSIPVAHDSSGVAITLTGIDPDVPALPLTFALGTSPGHGTVSGFNSTTGAVNYKPAAGYHGADSFTFTVNNGVNTSPSATVSLTVAIGTPTANAQSVTTSINTATGITLTSTDDDTPALTQTFAIGTLPANGSLTGFNSATGGVTYTPNTGYTGADSFTFTVTNGTNTSTAATVSINVSSSVVDVTSQLSIVRGVFQIQRSSGDYLQVLTLTNIGGSTINGPISLILSSLTNATLANATGLTSAITPAGRPYITTTVGSLASGASTQISLLFNKTGPTITYSTQVVAGVGPR